MVLEVINVKFDGQNVYGGTNRVQASNCMDGVRKWVH